MAASDINWDALGFVDASKYRTHVVEVLADGPEIPSQIATDEVPQPHISRTLSELREESIVELLVPEDRAKGRYYGLTEKGETVVANLEEVDG